MKINGYTLKRDEHGDGYIRHEYIVDGCNVQGEIMESDTCKSYSEAMKAMRKFCKMFDKVTIYNQWVEAEIDEYGNIRKYSTVAQRISDYRKGKMFNNINMFQL